MKARLASALILGLLVLGLGLWVGWERNPNPDSPAADEVLTATATRGPLEVFIEAAGTINTKESHKLVAMNKSRAALEFAVEEGTRVKPGDLLMKLNSEGLEDRILAEQEDVASDLLLISDRETGLQITKIEARTNIETASNNLKTAVMNQQKFISAERPQKIREAELAVRTGESDVQRHGQRLQELKNLLTKKFITASEVEEQQLVYDKAVVDLEGARLKMSALQTFELPVSLQELTNKIEQASLNLKKAEVSGNTKIKLSERALKKAQDDWERSKEKLAELIEQRAAYEYTSPVGGIVFYGDLGVSSYRRIRTLEVGEDISPGQVLMTIPIDSEMKAEIRITEADIKKVKVGMPAEIRVDAAEDRVYEGVVEKVAEAAIEQGYFSTGIKEFGVKVGLKDRSGLRQGFSCNVKILIERLDDAVQVPVQSVFKNKELGYHVFLRGGESRPVKIGASSMTHVQIVEGLEAGEEILLVRP